MRTQIAAIPPELLFWGIVILLAGWWLVMLLRKWTGVWRLRYFAFPRPWLKHLHAHVPGYERLPWELRAPYQDRVLHFVDSKIFRPGGALTEVTETMRVIIAGNACMLMLNCQGDTLFPGVLTVELYPQDEEEPSARSSAVAMLWDAEKNQATDPRDRDHSGLPGIAARLGLKAPPQPLLLTAWARARCAEFTAAHPGVLHPACPGEPEDVFAMATEVFYAMPGVLQQSQPALYDALRHFYKVDPARWSTGK